MLQILFAPVLENHTLESVWVQTYETTSHTAQISMQILREKFAGRLISVKDDILWPALADLTTRN